MVNIYISHICAGAREDADNRTSHIGLVKTGIDFFVCVLNKYTNGKSMHTATPKQHDAVLFTVRGAALRLITIVRRAFSAFAAIASEALHAHVASIVDTHALCVCVCSLTQLIGLHNGNTVCVTGTPHNITRTSCASGSSDHALRTLPISRGAELAGSLARRLLAR